MLNKILLGLLLIAVAIIGIVVVLASENALVVHPRGIISQDILQLIIVNIILMLLIVAPTYVLLFFVVWKYCIKSQHAKYDPNHSYGPLSHLLMWGFPSIIVIIMAIVTWEITHKLDPYKPIESKTKPIIVQVVALDWKWLFIYPEQGIAALNTFHIPERTPIHFMLTADGAPMNSFWIPQLSGQIYSMTGMTTQLHLMANDPGEFVGRAVEINGEGYSGMTFSIKSTSSDDFKKWIAQVKKSPERLTEENYNALVKPSINRSIILFSDVENNLFHKIVHKYMYPTKPVL